jgi:hypothetical protein
LAPRIDSPLHILWKGLLSRRVWPFTSLVTLPLGEGCGFSSFAKNAPPFALLAADDAEERLRKWLRLVFDTHGKISVSLDLQPRQLGNDLTPIVENGDLTPGTIEAVV